MKKSKRKKYANPLAPIHPQVTPKTGKPAPGFAPDAARSRHRALAPRHSQPISTKSEKGIRARRAGDPTRHLRDPQTFSSFTRHRASPPPAPLPLPRPHLLPPRRQLGQTSAFSRPRKRLSSSFLHQDELEPRTLEMRSSALLQKPKGASRRTSEILNENFRFCLEVERVPRPHTRRAC